MPAVTALRKMFGSVGHLFYPHTCAGCGSDILSADNFICTHCFTDLPYTKFELHASNPVEKIFWGRLPLRAAMSEFYFAKSSVIQQLIHQFKYKGNIDLGHFLGNVVGNSLLQSPRFKTIDAIVPLPLAIHKQQKRGFNQAQILCKGIAEILNIPVLDKCVIRQRYTDTQTKKHRIERWQNVEGSFVVIDQKSIKDKHILLVDDVVTTGATLEACGSQLATVEGVMLSVATLAYAAK
jgi:ComF family protein